MYSALISTISWLAGTPCSRASRGKRFEIVVTAGLRSWVVTSMKCDRCGHRVKVFNSCRNRSCPKCQATARANWLAAREAELLPVPYFHVTFTLSQQIGRLALPEPETDLHHPVSGCFRNSAHQCRRPQTPRRFHRLPRRAAHLGSEPASPSAPALRRARRRHLLRWQPLDRLSEGFFLPSL